MLLKQGMVRLYQLTKFVIAMEKLRIQGHPEILSTAKNVVQITLLDRH